MKNGPDIAYVASLIGDPSRANMLSALMCGKALTATELSQEAGITLQTASSHLKQLTEGGLIIVHKQGRHRYFSLANDNIAKLIESLMGVAFGAGHIRARPGPKDEMLRYSRICYSHLAGYMGIKMYDGLVAREFLKLTDSGLQVTDASYEYFENFGINLKSLEQKKSPLCRECLDWSERRPHLAGNLGRAILNKVVDLEWAKPIPNTRIIRFTKKGEELFKKQFFF